jgi:hypothetical protein
MDQPAQFHFFARLFGGFFMGGELVFGRGSPNLLDFLIKYRIVEV